MNSFCTLLICTELCHVHYKPSLLFMPYGERETPTSCVMQSSRWEM